MTWAVMPKCPRVSTRRCETRWIGVRRLADALAEPLQQRRLRQQPLTLLGVVEGERRVRLTGLAGRRPRPARAARPRRPRPRVPGAASRAAARRRSPAPPRARPRGAGCACSPPGRTRAAGDTAVRIRSKASLVGDSSGSTTCVGASSRRRAPSASAWLRAARPAAAPAAVTPLREWSAHCLQRRAGGQEHAGDEAARRPARPRRCAR